MAAETHHVGRRVKVADLRDWCAAVLRSAGSCEGHARTTADVLATTDSWGVFTHGTKLLAGYVRRLRCGGIRSDVQPAVAAEGPAWATVDGRSALGQVTGVAAMQVAIAKARAAGVGYVGVRNSNHFGAAGYYTWLAARAGLVGIAMCNDTPSVAAPGSRSPVTGTNPIAYAIPAGERDPVLLDIAISTVAGGKVYAARQSGRPIPSDWLIDRSGRPTSDATLYPENASLAPMTAHKGYGLALLVESLSGLATGAAVTWQVGSWMWGDPAVPTRHGAAFLAIDVAAMSPPGEFVRRVHSLIDEIHATPTAEGVDRVLVPGEPQWAMRRTSEVEGIPLPSDVVTPLDHLAQEVGLPIPWMAG